MSDPRATVEAVARSSYGRLLAYLAVRSKDLAACEDALAEAFATAIRSWEERGVPERPDGWLLTVARNRLRDGARHRDVAARAGPTLLLLADELAAEEAPIDERLQLMFLCAHPAIARADRTPLMLQVVLGLDAAAVARAFLVSEAAMAKRLVRAKRKIREAAIPFELPPPERWSARLDAVLDAVYAAYGHAWDRGLTADAPPDSLRREAVLLAELLHRFLPEEPGPAALLALMLYCDAREEARRGETFKPLEEQPVALWDLELIARAEALLRGAAARPSLGRFGLEAAIQSCHINARVRGADTRRELLALYDALCAAHPSVGAELGRCAALGRKDPAAALARLETLAAQVASDHQPLWALRAELLARLGRPGEARAAYQAAIALTADPAVRRWLDARALSLAPQ